MGTASRSQGWLECEAENDRLTAENERLRTENAILKKSRDLSENHVIENLRIELARAWEDGREEAELECIQAVCELCQDGAMPERPTGQFGWQHADKSHSICGASGIHERRYQRATRNGVEKSDEAQAQVEKMREALLAARDWIFNRLTSTQVPKAFVDDDSGRELLGKIAALDGGK